MICIFHIVLGLYLVGCNAFKVPGTATRLVKANFPFTAEAGGLASDRHQCSAADVHLQSYEKHKVALASNPTDKDARFKVAKAALDFLRAKTNANAITLHGTMDTPENLALWNAYAPEAYGILQELHKAYPNDVDIHMLRTEAYTYLTSAKGILKAAVTGAGVVFIRYVKQIVDKYPTYDCGLPFIYRGAFLIAAPWPLKDVKGGLAAFQRAYDIEPRSLRNNYFLGIGAYYAGDFAMAIRHFEIATVEAKCMAPTEGDVADFLRSEAHASLQQARIKLVESKRA